MKWPYIKNKPINRRLSENPAKTWQKTKGTCVFDSTRQKTMSLEKLNQDIITSIFINLELATIRSAMLTCSSLRDIIIESNDLWRYLQLRDFGLNSFGHQANPHLIYKESFQKSYNLHFGKNTSSKLSWKSYKKLVSYIKNIKNGTNSESTLDIEIGEGLPARKFPFPREKILKDYNSVVVHEFIMKEKLGKIEMTIIKKAIKVLVSKIIEGKYLFNEHIEENEKNSKKKFPLKYHIVNNILYIAYFYNAKTILSEQIVANKNYDFFCLGSGDAENCIEAFKTNFKIGFADNHKRDHGMFLL
jgi:hypothetical protein